MVHTYVLTASVVFYPDQSAYGYKIYARGLNDPFLVVASPGKYENCLTALAAGDQEIKDIERKMRARDIRLGLVGEHVNGAA